MKNLLLAVIASGIAMTSFAQNDSTQAEKPDTIKVGGIIIIKKPGEGKDHEVIISNHHHHKNPNSRISTNWVILDLGFANWNDKTNYSSPETQAFAKGFTDKDQLDLKTNKSVNVNIWLFMQKFNITKNILGLKYGLGLELNNYHFDDTRVHFYKNPAYITLDSAYTDLKKNKLAADYITIPMMVNVNFTPDRSNGFGFSFGVSAGLLYSSRQKIKYQDGNKNKLHDDFNLNTWKLSYIGELNLGPVKLYGSYAFKSMWEKGLDQTPYNVGIRFSHW
jgi:hypothetical protein